MMKRLFFVLVYGFLFFPTIGHPLFAAEEGCVCSLQGEPNIVIPGIRQQSLCRDQTLDGYGQLTNCRWRSIQAPANQDIQEPRPSSQQQTQPASLIDERLKTDITSLDQFKGKKLPQVIGTIIKTAMGMLGALALIIFIYGGIIWMLARGNATEHEKAFKTIFWAGLGVAVIFASYALVSYVFEAFR